MNQKSSAPPARVPAEKLVRDIRRASCEHLLDLPRFFAATLITYCAAKGMNHGHSQDG